MREGGRRGAEGAVGCGGSALGTSPGLWCWVWGSSRSPHSSDRAQVEG